MGILHINKLINFKCDITFNGVILNFIQVLKQKNGKLENRSNLVTVCKMGPKIFINCAGFIKIDTKCMEDR